MRVAWTVIITVWVDVTHRWRRQDRDDLLYTRLQHAALVSLCPRLRRRRQAKIYDSYVKSSLAVAGSV